MNIYKGHSPYFVNISAYCVREVDIFHACILFDSKFYSFVFILPLHISRTLTCT